MSPPEWGSAFLKTPRGQILTLIRRRPSTAAELAEATGITPNGVRSQLLLLERDGWIRPAGLRRVAGAGKPSTEYEFSHQGERLLSAAYRPFLLALLESLRDRMGQDEIASALEAAGRRLAAQVRPDGAAMDRAGAVAILEDMGASISVKEEGFRVVLEGSGCP
ncbi:MAG: FaeA/PapI family transcriptional regulator, partial [Gemmatimonadota bacterium]